MIVTKLMELVELGGSLWNETTIEVNETKEFALSDSLRLGELLDSLDPGGERRDAISTYQVAQKL